LAFDSRRLGSADIFRANRETTEDAFAAPRPVDALNSAYEDTAPAISLEFSYVVFSSDREGSVDIFEAHWPDSMP
jgi:Tol biopolymer transport system component